MNTHTVLGPHGRPGGHDGGNAATRALERSWVSTQMEVGEVGAAMLDPGPSRPVAWQGRVVGHLAVLPGHAAGI